MSQADRAKAIIERKTHEAERVRSRVKKRGVEDKMKKVGETARMSFLSKEISVSNRYRTERDTESEEILTERLKKIGEQSNESSYQNILEKLLGVTSLSIEKNTFFKGDIDKILRYTDNEKSELYLWYPHIFERDDTQDIDNLYLSKELFKYGAYHFEICYYPEFDDTSALNIIHKTIKEFTTTMAKEGSQHAISNLVDTFGEGIKGMTTKLQGYAQLLKSGQTEKVLEQLEGDLRTFLVDVHVEKHYKNKSKLKSNIYLPMNKLSINRKSGVQQVNDAITNIGTTILRRFDDFQRERSGLWGDFIKVRDMAYGRARREFRAPRVSTPSLETRELEWELIPRTFEEQKHILLIISFFSSLSTPTFEDNSYMLHMPPMLFMNIVSSKIKGNLEFEEYKLTEKQQFYLTDFTIDFKYNEDSVMLDENGIPMGVSLKIQLIKNDIMKGSELFKNPFL